MPRRIAHRATQPGNAVGHAPLLVLHQRREGVAEEFFVHPQPVRYCMSQLRELYGDRPEDPSSSWK